MPIILLLWPLKFYVKSPHNINMKQGYVSHSRMLNLCYNSLYIYVQKYVQMSTGTRRKGNTYGHHASNCCSTWCTIFVLFSFPIKLMHAWINTHVTHTDTPAHTHAPHIHPHIYNTYTYPLSSHIHTCIHIYTQFTHIREHTHAYPCTWGHRHNTCMILTHAYKSQRKCPSVEWRWTPFMRVG